MSQYIRINEPCVAHPAFGINHLIVVQQGFRVLPPPTHSPMEALTDMQMPTLRTAPSLPSPKQSNGAWEGIITTGVGVL